MNSSCIVSLAPSTTRIIIELGCENSLAGVTKHCPPTGTNPPVVGGWVTPDIEQITSVDPDIVLTTDALQEHIYHELSNKGLNVWHCEPTSIDEIIDAIEDIAKVIGVPQAGLEVTTNFENELNEIDCKTPSGNPRPTVYCEEWMDPPMAAGNWVPEIVNIAGGKYPFVSPGERSTKISQSKVESIDPDFIVFNVCGHGKDISLDSFQERGWDVTSELIVVDDTLLNEPSTKLVEGARFLANKIE